MTVINDSKLKFFSVEGEIYRTYVFPGFDEITLLGCTDMARDKDGSHRLLDIVGKAHHIPGSWIHLFWEVEEGTSQFRW